MMGFNMLGSHGISYMHGLHSFGMIARTGGMIMFMLILVAIIVVAIVWFSKNGNKRNSGVQQQSSTDRSLEILNERYAMGEIEDEEYAKKKMELKKSGL